MGKAHADTIPCTLVWRRILDEQSFELMSLDRASYGFRFRGLVVASENGAPLRVTYGISCDGAWQTRACVIEQTLGTEKKRLLLEHRDEQWFVDGTHAPSLEGCTDVDLGLSPVTNTLAINRLRLGPGGQESIRAAWVKFPALNVEAGPQSYERLSEKRYLYRSLGSDFKAVLDVDEAGLVVTYEGIWKRIAVSSGDALAAFAYPGFADALVSEAASPELGAQATDFDWLVGGWSATVRDHRDDGAVLEQSGEWWFSWALEGRAIQDVWIVPPRGQRAGAGRHGNRYGTTIRTFDNRNGLWRIVWINPVTGVKSELAGKRTDSRIVLEGTIDGERARWSFDDISPARFVWRGETLSADGAWKLGAEFVMTRII